MIRLKIQHHTLTRLSNSPDSKANCSTQHKGPTAAQVHLTAILQIFACPASHLDAPDNSAAQRRDGRRQLQQRFAQLPLAVILNHCRCKLMQLHAL